MVFFKKKPPEKNLIKAKCFVREYNFSKTFYNNNCKLYTYKIELKWRFNDRKFYKLINWEEPKPNYLQTSNFYFVDIYVNEKGGFIGLKTDEEPIFKPF